MVRHLGLHILSHPIFPPSQEENTFGFYAGCSPNGTNLGSSNGHTILSHVPDCSHLPRTTPLSWDQAYLGVSIDFIITILPRPCLKAIAWSTVRGDSVFILSTTERRSHWMQTIISPLASSSKLQAGFDILPGPGLSQVT